MASEAVTNRQSLWRRKGTVKFKLFWEPRDLWVGVFLKKERDYFLKPAFHVYICPLPTVVLHFVWIGKRDRGATHR